MVVVLVAGATGGIGSSLLNRLVAQKHVGGHPISGLIILDLFAGAVVCKSIIEKRVVVEGRVLVMTLRIVRIDKELYLAIVDHIIRTDG